MPNSARKAKPKAVSEKKKKFCTHSGCKNHASSKGLCRLHYISHWREISQAEKKKAEKRLDAYVDKLAKKYPGDYMDRIREGLEDETKFKQSVEELDLGEEAERSETEREFLEKLLRDFKIGSE